MSETSPQAFEIQEGKSVGLAVVLTLVFGPLGMFYSTIVGGLIMLVVSVILFVLTIGLSLFITWPICVIWGALAAHGNPTRVVTQSG